MNRYFNSVFSGKRRFRAQFRWICTCAAIWIPSIPVFALDLDWSGQFRTESHWIYNWPMDNGNLMTDTTSNGNFGRYNEGGYYIPGGGSKNTYFQTLFLKLRPTIIVNDNIYIKSEWWVGDPIYSFFGSGAPYTSDERAYNSTFLRGSTITAQRVWAEFLSEVGTVQAGRLPLDWGLGIVWNAGNNMNDRYASTGDALRLVSKLGSFTFAPALIKYSMGNNIGGNCPDPTVISSTKGCNSTIGSGTVSDMSLAVKYENPDESVEMGVNFIKRITGSPQGPQSGLRGIDTSNSTSDPRLDVNIPASANYNTWDLYGKKAWGPISVGVEAPIVSGRIGTASYKTFALATEGNWKINDAWETSLKMGHAPGQSDATTTTVDSYRAFYFNPNYKIALILFNYQFANFAGPNNLNDPRINPALSTSGSKLASPYDNPIVNANYLAWTGAFHTQKWSFRTNWAFAKAREVAGTGGKLFNYWEKQFRTRPAVAAQDPWLGWEMDYGTTFRWDDAFRFDLDFGWFFPGEFYQYSNTVTPNAVSSVFAIVFRAGVAF